VGAEIYTISVTLSVISLGLFIATGYALSIFMRRNEVTLRRRAKMDQFVGLDVSQEITHLCVIGGDGKTVWQGKCLSTPEDIAGTIKSKAPDVVRIGLESGPLSTRHWHALKAMGLPVVCLDARHAQATMSGQVNKTDKNDAYGLAQIVKAGWYREVG
jgi:transposase